MELISLRLVRKSGGRSGEWHRPDEEARTREAASTARGQELAPRAAKKSKT